MPEIKNKKDPKKREICSFQSSFIRKHKVMSHVFLLDHMGETSLARPLTHESVKRGMLIFKQLALTFLRKKYQYLLDIPKKLIKQNLVLTYT